ncbi:sensor histidine kinase [Neolewinella antarctica]|uniref:histidine kinase n=1 Tax=Neolewinella antarctica TaxID=442734 RepID=A0ABX0XG86_9BACT|nr:sensor histidine kinase [Neolewinella antarctica]NJC28320.1 two-component sensor histidine kinase [Neolewinella antarctica]
MAHTPQRLRVFLLLFCLPLVASLYGQQINERLDVILASPADTHQVRALTRYVDSLSGNMLEVSDSLFDLALELARDLDDDRGLAELYTERYAYCLNGRKIAEGQRHVARAIEYARTSGRDDLLRSAYLTEVMFLMVSGDTEEAATRASALAREFRTSGNLIGESEAYGILASLSSGFGNYDLAVIYDSTSIDLALRSKSPETIERSYLTASMSSTYRGNAVAGLDLAEKALAVSQEIGSTKGIKNGLSARAAANVELGNYDEALADYKKLKVGQGEQKATWRMTSMGNLLQRTGKHTEARAILLEVVRMVQATSRDPIDLIETYRALQTVGLNQMQYDSVVRYERLIAEQQDSLQTEKNIKTLFELEEKYHAEEQENEIQLQQERLSRQQIKLYAMVCGLVLALVAVGVFYLLSQRLKKRNAENEQLLKDKETLIGEIHHRVKNNLQVISSLLQLQRRGLGADNEKGREALLESQSRVAAMGLIHNKLYQGTEVTSVHMPEYLENLGETLLDAYSLEEQVEVFYDVADIKLDVDVAIPLGLIINELITNALKYAFPQGREGTIAIGLHHDQGHLRLSVIDNGVGVLAAEKRSDSTSFGTNLIKLLTDKLRGTARVLDVKGYGIEIIFDK